jgi:hypothetical protein
MDYGWIVRSPGPPVITPGDHIVRGLLVVHYPKRNCSVDLREIRPTQVLWVFSAVSSAAAPKENQHGTG